MSNERSELWRVVRRFAIEMTIYAALMSVYFVVVLRFLVQPLTELYHNDNHLLYALAALGLIAGQGALLDALTSFLVRLAGLDSHSGGPAGH